MSEFCDGRKNPAVDLVPLAVALLCEDCDLISAGKNGRCAGCGSSATMRLAGILNDSEMRRVGRIGQIRLRWREKAQRASMMKR
jgi:hypothetical protein